MPKDERSKTHKHRLVSKLAADQRLATKHSNVLKSAEERFQNKLDDSNQ